LGAIGEDLSVELKENVATPVVIVDGPPGPPPDPIPVDATIVAPLPLPVTAPLPLDVNATIVAPDPLPTLEQNLPLPVWDAVAVLSVGSNFFSLTSHATPLTPTPFPSYVTSKGVLIANPATTGTLYIGGVGVTPTTAIYRLLPGQTAPIIPANNANELYTCSDTTLLPVSYMAY
jgi:hypothetical protein